MARTRALATEDYPTVEEAAEETHRRPVSEDADEVSTLEVTPPIATEFEIRVGD